MNELRLFWWNKQPNFGDSLSRDVVAHVSGQHVVWSPPRDADLFALGSLMRHVRRGHSAPRTGEKPVIWGTGIKEPHRFDFTDNVEFASVRGPLTASLLEVHGIAMGDPGLLASDLLDELPSKNGKIGIVLHINQTLPEPDMKALRSDDRFEFIDVKNKDHMTVVKQIAACDFVLSSSLHGLIVADAFEVPNHWLDPNDIGKTAQLKFYDYALSVDRFLGAPVPLVGIREFVKQMTPRRSGYFDKVSRVKETIRASFPSSMRACA